MKTYQDLAVWQGARALAVKTYKVTNQFPREESKGLVDQMRRAAVSVASNIAEGHDRNSDKEFAQFIGIARGSAAELTTQILIATDLGYISQDEAAELVTDCEIVRKQLNALKATLKI